MNSTIWQWLALLAVVAIAISTTILVAVVAHAAQ